MHVPGWHTATAYLQEQGKVKMVGIIQEIIKQSSGGAPNPIGAALTGGVIIFMPLFIIFIFAQRYFIEGLTLGGIK